MIRNWCNQNQYPALQHRWVPTEITLIQNRRTYGKPYGQIFPKTVVTQFLNLTVLPNIYLRVKFDLVSCSFNSTDRRHVNIVDLSPGEGGGDTRKFFLYIETTFGVKVSNFCIFLGGLQKENEYFLVRQLLWIFFGVQ